MVHEGERLHAYFETVLLYIRLYVVLCFPVTYQEPVDTTLLENLNISTRTFKNVKYIIDSNRCCSRLI